MNKTNFFLFILIFGVCAIGVQFVLAVPVAPSPTCQVKGEILSVTYSREVHVPPDDRPCSQPTLYYPSRSILEVKVYSVSTIEYDGAMTCGEMYPVNSEKVLIILADDANNDYTLERGKIIEGTVNFSGDECFSGKFVTDYTVSDTIYDKDLTDRMKGKILLQVESRGEAWYVDISTGVRFYLKDGIHTYQALRRFGLGITNANLDKIPVGIEDRFEDTDSDGDGLNDKLEEALGTDLNKPDTDNDGFNDRSEVLGGYNPLGPGMKHLDNNLSSNLKGKIVLQVESRGEAWYIHPDNGKR